MEKYSFWNYHWTFWRAFPVFLGVLLGSALMKVILDVDVTWGQVFISAILAAFAIMLTEYILQRYILKHRSFD
jgi:uncharacterized BrkB/YihY/UPF0761 family membrane protein